MSGNEAGRPFRDHQRLPQVQPHRGLVDGKAWDPWVDAERQIPPSGRTDRGRDRPTTVDLPCASHWDQKLSPFRVRKSKGDARYSRSRKEKKDLEAIVTYLNQRTGFNYGTSTEFAPTLRISRASWEPF